MFAADLFGESARIFTVGELTRSIRGTLETKFGAVWVQGEISNYKSHSSGHQYFTLKDQRAQIACVIFRNTLRPEGGPAPLPALRDGAQVQVFGQISVFEARGQYQLSVQIVQARGLGLLQARFEALKRKLDAEGLFDPARKRKLPRFPKRIGIITSASGAAIRDLLNVLQRRAPGLQILISPVRVQGSGAAAEIAVALRELSRPNECWPPLDLIVLARGGGSIEDLWEFNEEIVARAIFDSPVPIVSAVGHEIDFTIADFVADLRAPTPSAAAELIVADVTEISRRLHERSAQLERHLRNFLAHAQTRLRFLSEKAIARELQQRLRESHQRTDLARVALERAAKEFAQRNRHLLARHAQILEARTPVRELMERRARFDQLQRRLGDQPPILLQKKRETLRRVEGLLRVLSPNATLQRGYSMTRNEDGEIVRSIVNVSGKEKIRTSVSDGEIMSQVSRTDAKALTPTDILEHQ